MTAAALLLAVAFAFPNEQGTRLLATGRGSALSQHIAEGSGQFKELISDSWYHSPL